MLATEVSMNDLACIDYQSSDPIGYIESIQDAYTPHVKTFTEWLVNAGYQDITLEAVTEYLEDLVKSDYAPATIAIKRAAVKKRLTQLFLHAPIEEQIRLDRFLKNLDTGSTRAPKEANTGVGKDKVLSAMEIEKLLAGCRTERQRLFIRFLLSTGCRVAELCGIENRHCEPHGAGVRIHVRGKGSKWRFVVIPSALFAEIQRCFAGSRWLFETGGMKPYLTTYVSGQIAKLGHRILDRKISAHTMRHTFATHWLRRYPSQINQLSKYLGHASVSITLDLYVHDEADETDVLEFAAELAGVCSESQQSPYVA